MSLVGEPRRIGNQMVVFMLQVPSIHITYHGDSGITSPSIYQNGMNPLQHSLTLCWVFS